MIYDWQERTAMLVGEEMLDHFRNSTVAVIGVGGVGGYAAEMIVRAGVGHLIILDSDDVSVTNKNRQLLALDSTVGRQKCDVLAERLKDINPELDLIVIKEYLEAEKAGEVLGQYKIDFLVDAIDTLSPKLHLIKYCVDNGIPLVSSMGAGAKYDATKVRIADVSKSFNCPLAYIVRKRGIWASRRDSRSFFQRNFLTRTRLFHARTGIRSLRSAQFPIFQQFSVVSVLRLLLPT